MARTIALTLEYDGAGLSGWQRQKNGPTVQQHVETALSQILNSPTQVVGASRTDAGVHARGQVCHFRTERPIPTDNLQRGLNSLMPDSIAVLEAREVADGFHARFGARGKDYRYLVHASPVGSPLWAARSWHVRAPLDLAEMARAADQLLGEHDFSAFRATGCSAKTTTRHIHGISVTPGPGSLIGIGVRGNAFLRNMVRILAGTLVEVGRGRLTSQDVKTILESRDRTRAGQTAPAPGLTLVRVYYEEPERAPPDPFADLIAAVM